MYKKNKKKCDNEISRVLELKESLPAVSSDGMFLCFNEDGAWWWASVRDADLEEEEEEENEDEEEEEEEGGAERLDFLASVW